MTWVSLCVVAVIPVLLQVMEENDRLKRERDERAARDDPLEKFVQDADKSFRSRQRDAPNGRVGDQQVNTDKQRTSGQQETEPIAFSAADQAGLRPNHKEKSPEAFLRHIRAQRAFLSSSSSRTNRGRSKDQADQPSSVESSPSWRAHAHKADRQRSREESGSFLAKGKSKKKIYVPRSSLSLLSNGGGKESSLPDSHGDDEEDVPIKKSRRGRRKQYPRLSVLSVCKPVVSFGDSTTLTLCMRWMVNPDGRLGEFARRSGKHLRIVVGATKLRICRRGGESSWCCTSRDGRHPNDG